MPIIPGSITPIRDTSLCIDLNRESFCPVMWVAANTDLERGLLFVDKDVQDAHWFGDVRGWW
jgi:hypothetical protein